MMTNEQYIKERYLLEFRRHSNCKKANKMEERGYSWFENNKDWIPFREVRVKNNNITQWAEIHNPEYPYSEFRYIYVGDQYWHNIYMLHRKVGPWIH